jgi:hypothetical protein
LDQVDEVYARCLARLVVTPKQADEIFRAIGNGLGKIVK